MVSSDIPIAAGLGSGAAVATALVRAVAAYAGRVLPPDVVAALVHRCEQHYHGNPSGIDNTVVAFEQAIWFERGTGRDFDNPDHAPTTAMEELHQLASFVRKPAGNLVEPVELGEPLTLVIGDTGKRSETRLPVGEVRRRWQAAQQEYEYLFNRVDYIVRQARVALASGDLTSLGILLNENQEALEEMGVSSPELDHLIAAALAAGAWGAKLSGGGWGGVMLALTDEDESAAVAEALRRAGAAHVSITTVE
jgi:mevalonate kinase